MPSSSIVNPIVVVERGGCSFTEKTEFAQNVGAKALIITNRVESLYINGTINLVDACSTDCDAGSSYEQMISPDAVFSAFPKSECASSSSCDSNKCALMWNGIHNQSKGYHICCIVDKYMPVYVNETYLNQKFNTKIPVQFLNLESSAILWSELTDSEGFIADITIKFRKVPFDLTGIWMWMVGCSVVFIASQRSASKERAMVKKGTFRDENEALVHEQDDDLETVDISITMAISFLIWSCIALVGLYFLLKAGEQAVVLIMILLFCLGR